MLSLVPCRRSSTPAPARPRSVSGTHANPLGVKTDAPWAAVWDVMRCWVADHPVKKPAPGSAGARGAGSPAGRARPRARARNRTGARAPSRRPPHLSPCCSDCRSSHIPPPSLVGQTAAKATPFRLSLLPSLRPPAAEKILGREPELKADFARAAGAVSKAKQKGLARFPVNGVCGRVGMAVGGGCARMPGAGAAARACRRGADAGCEGWEREGVCGARPWRSAVQSLLAAEANWGPKPRHNRQRVREPSQDADVAGGAGQQQQQKQEQQEEEQQPEQQQQQQQGQEAAANGSGAAAPAAADGAEPMQQDAAAPAGQQ